MSGNRRDVSVMRSAMQYRFLLLDQLGFLRAVSLSSASSSSSTPSFIFLPSLPLIRATTKSTSAMLTHHNRPPLPPRHLPEARSPHHLPPPPPLLLRPIRLPLPLRFPRLHRAQRTPSNSSPRPT
jgi:hypothetical protein